MLETKRRVIGQLIICKGCCCGATQNGRPEVPVEWLKEEWRKRRLLKRFQLSISGCLGPCDLPNVARNQFRIKFSVAGRDNGFQSVQNPGRMGCEIS